MLVCMLKGEEDKNCKAEIVKYGDRIWIDPIRISCIREFIVSLASDSKPLSRIRMLLPFKHVLELRDLCETLLDENYLFNGFHSCGYKLERVDPIQKKGNIICDDFKNVEVIYGDYNLLLSTSFVRNANLIEIYRKNEPLKPGSLWMVRVSFKVTSVLNLLSEDNYLFETEYFEGFDFKEELEHLGWPDLEIPFKKIYNPKTKQGGIDVLLYLQPPLHGTRFNAYKETTSKHRFDGTEGQENLEKYIWRGRVSFPNNDYLELGKTPWQVQGTIVDTSGEKERSRKINEVWIETNKNRILSYWAIGLAIVSIFVSIFVNIITYLCKK